MRRLSSVSRSFPERPDTPGFCVNPACTPTQSVLVLKTLSASETVSGASSGTVEGCGPEMVPVAVM